MKKNLVLLLSLAGDLFDGAERMRRTGCDTRLRPRHRLPPKRLPPRKRPPPQRRLQQPLPPRQRPALPAMILGQSRVDPQAASWSKLSPVTSKAQP